VLSVVSPIMYFTLNLTPYAAMWVLLAFLYIFMPNTKVPYKSGLLAGFVAGSLFNLFQWAYVFFQVGLARYNAIYGSFAALPLFILWLNYSWTIVLLGAEMACAHQNASARRFSLGGDELSHRARRLLALGVMHRLVRSFEQKGDHQDARSLAAHFKIGTPQIESIVQELIQAGLVSAVRRPEDEHLFYQPGRDPDKMTIWSVCREWESVGAAPDLVDSPDDERRRLADSLEKLDDQAERSPANRRLKDV
jgi:membrane protein